MRPKPKLFIPCYAVLNHSGGCLFFVRLSHEVDSEARHIKREERGSEPLNHNRCPVAPRVHRDRSSYHESDFCDQEEQFDVERPTQGPIRREAIVEVLLLGAHEGSCLYV